MELLFAAPDKFCFYHKGMGKIFVRCCHRGNKYVVQAQGYTPTLPERGCVDYVSLKGEDVDRCYTVGYFDDADTAQVLWGKGIRLLESDAEVPEN